MRITFLLTQSLDSPGGSGRFFPLAAELVQLGHTVTILALHHDLENASRLDFVQDGVDVRYVAQMHVRKVGNDKIYFPPLKLLWITLLATWQLTRYAIQQPCDVIHVCKSQPMNSVAARIAALIKRVPVFVDSDDYEAGNNRFSGRWQQNTVAAFEDWVPSFSTGLTIGNRFIYDRYLERGVPAAKMKIVHNGVPRNRFSSLDQAGMQNKIAELRRALPFSADARLIVYVGTISLTSHAMDLLLDAFEDVVSQVPAAGLLLVGAGEDLDEMQYLATQKGLINSVHFLGRVAPDEVPVYYRLGEFSVDPRRQTVAAESSLSLKLVESIAAGVPCITADIGDRAELGGGACIAVPADDRNALASAMIELLQNPAKLTALTDAAAELGETHFWDKRVRAFESIYELAAVHTGDAHV